MQTPSSALDFACHAHRDQRDKSGRPYFEHVERVYHRVEALLRWLPRGTLTKREEAEILMAAALHDTAEDKDDTGVTHEDLAAAGFPEGTLRLVRRLDKRFKVGGSYQENIEAMAAEGDLGVILVKLADNLDNGDPARIASLPPEERSISRRYERARTVLVAAYRAAGGGEPAIAVHARSPVA